MLGAGLEDYKGEGSEKMKKTYAKKMWALTQDQVESQPWEAHYWASYLKDFLGPQHIKTAAATLMQRLESDPKVQQALEAEKDIRKLADTYFRVFYTVDQKPNESRTKDAERMSEKYPDIPHSELVKRLGDPC